MQQRFHKAFEKDEKQIAIEIISENTSINIYRMRNGEYYDRR